MFHLDLNGWERRVFLWIDDLWRGDGRCSLKTPTVAVSADSFVNVVKPADMRLVETSWSLSVSNLRDRRETRRSPATADPEPEQL